jgi:hypothetical protein
MEIDHRDSLNDEHKMGVGPTHINFTAISFISITGVYL